MLKLHANLSSLIEDRVSERSSENVRFSFSFQKINSQIGKQSTNPKKVAAIDVIYTDGDRSHPSAASINASRVNQAGQLLYLVLRGTGLGSRSPISMQGPSAHTLSRCGSLIYVKAQMSNNTLR
jgi:hypothetical protein